MVWTVPHPTANAVRLVGSPLKLSETPVMLRSHPPLLGEHTNEVLTDLLGYSSEALARLRKDGAI
jgi:crotonobetainyl-CoA:carnitine CoA-transferase CaiB-like acyl-CoA transferase